MPFLDHNVITLKTFTMRTHLIFIILFTFNHLFASQILTKDSLPHLLVYEKVSKHGNVHTYYLVIADQMGGHFTYSGNKEVLSQMEISEGMIEIKLRVFIPNDVELLTDTTYYRGWHFDSALRHLTITLYTWQDGIEAPLYIDMYCKRQVLASEMQMQILSPHKGTSEKKHGYDWTNGIGIATTYANYDFFSKRGKLVFRYSTNISSICKGKSKKIYRYAVRLVCIDENGKVLERKILSDLRPCKVRNKYIKNINKMTRYIFIGNGPYTKHYFFDLQKLDPKPSF
jgi:hypothetical protein